MGIGEGKGVFGGNKKWGVEGGVGTFCCLYEEDQTVKSVGLLENQEEYPFGCLGMSLEFSAVFP